MPYSATINNGVAQVRNLQVSANLQTKALTGARGERLGWRHAPAVVDSFSRHVALTHLNLHSSAQQPTGYYSSDLGQIIND